MLFGKKNKEKPEAPKVKKNGRYTLNDGPLPFASNRRN